MRRAARVLRSPHAFGLLLRALSVVICARAALSLRISDGLRAHIQTVRQRNIPRHIPDEPLHDLREIAWSVSATARLVPGASCLTQAIAGDWLLARRGRPGEIRITLPKDASAGFRPHAWLLSDDRILLGGDEVEFNAHRAFRARAPHPHEVSG